MRLLRAWFVALACMFFVSQAGAHARLVHAFPRDGATLASPPAEVVLSFDHAVTPLVLTLVDPRGRPLPLRSVAQASDTTVRAPMPPRLRAGSYLLSYRVVSSDSHPVVGTIAFSVGAATARPAGAALLAQGRDNVTLQAALRTARDIALLSAVGAALFVLFVARFPRERRVLSLAGAAAALLSLGAIPVQGAALLGAAVGFDAALWHAGWASTGQSSSLAMAGALAILAASFVLARPIGRGMLLAGALLAIASLPLTGHALASTRPMLAVPALAVHAAAAAFWLGSLLALHGLLKQRDDKVVSALQDFSRIAIWAVALLALAGAGLAALRLASLELLWDSRYGRLILLKAALLAALVLIALRNHFVLMPRISLPADRAIAALRRAVQIELLLLVLVLGTTGVLTQTAPPSTSITRQAKAGESAAIVHLSPARVGWNALEVRLVDGQGRPIAAQEVQLHLGSRQLDIAPIVREAQRIGGGVYRHEGSELLAPGTWEITIQAQIDDFDLLEFELSVDLDPEQEGAP